MLKKTKIEVLTISFLLSQSLIAWILKSTGNFTLQFLS